MDMVTVRANVPLPELSYGEVGTLPRTSRVAGLLASRRLTEIPSDEPDPDDVPGGTIAEVLAWVRAGDDPDERANRAVIEEYARERPRSTLLEELEAPGRDESADDEPEG